MRTISALSLMFAFAMVAGCLGENSSSIVFSQQKEADLDLGGRPARQTVAFSKLRPAFLGSTYNQYYSFGQSYDSDDPTRLALYNGPVYASQYNLAEPKWTQSFEFSASFELVNVFAKTSDHYYIAGYDGAEDVVERWKKAPVLPGPGNPGTYVMKRTQLFRGNLGRIKCISVDHLTRFVLIVHGSNPTLISKISLPSGGQPVTVYSSSQIPQLNSIDADGCFPRKHTAHGIVWTIVERIPRPSDNVIVLYDTQDDGIIDTWNVFTNYQFTENEPSSSELWEDWFMTD